MRLIACHICGGLGYWVVFDSMILCDSCRQVPPDWFFRHLSLHPHPFLDEFNITSPHKANVRVVK